MEWLMFVAVFFATAIADIIWALWAIHTAQLKPLHSANTAALIILVGAVTVLAYVSSPIFLIPAAMGAWVGTYLTVWHKKRKSLGA